MSQEWRKLWSMARTRRGGDDDLSGAERARNRRRDRIREPRMVLDNQGVKRLLGALARRRREKRAPGEGPGPAR